MVQAGLIEIEEAEYEKDGEIKRYRKVRLTEAGRDVRTGFTAELLISDGMVEEFGGPGETAGRGKKVKAPAGGGGASEAIQVPLTAEGEAVAMRIKEWRATEAKRLRVPAYVVMHDRTLAALAQARPRNPKELLEIDGIGPAKVEKFGEAILGLCGGGPRSPMG
jgi:superfamily II DNA helicase RecQ